jgi:hypothetical protein
MSDYHQLMSDVDRSVRTNYSYDPRVMVHNATRYSDHKIEAFTGPKQTSNTPVESSLYTNQPFGSHSDANIVQASPKTTAVKRYVIVDASQRDWVKQPNPFSNITFSFGQQSSNAVNPPVYSNNSFIPTFSVEQSNLPAPIPGLPNVQGWSLPSTPSNISYPPYNSSLPKGNFIAYDTGYEIQASGSGFGSVFTPCNVRSIRLVRAVLPQRQFLSIPIDPAGTDASLSATIQASIVNTAFSTFSTYPYLMFYLNEYFGQYVGGNEPTRRSFSVMTQKQRTQTNFQTIVGVQQYDYEPWGEEALHFQSPITNLQKIQISITDPIGTTFQQNDNLSISLIQATADKMFLKCFTGSFQYFSGNEVRIGDRVSFYSNSLVNVLKSPILNSMGPDNRAFVLALQNNTFPVLQLLDYVIDNNGIYNPRDSNSQRTQPYISSFNGFLIPNFVTIDQNGYAVVQYPGSIDGGSFNVLEPNELIGSNIPFLNVTLQPVYTLELDILQPDTTGIGGSIVL